MANSQLFTCWHGKLIGLIGINQSYLFAMQQQARG